MYDTEILAAVRGGPDKPDWDPLEAFLPLILCGRFMWMHSVVLEDGTRINAYKHGDTRAYLYLDGEGDSWERLGGGFFRRMRHSEALEFVFDSPWLLDCATDEEREALRAALAAAWERGNGDRAAGFHIVPCSPASGFRQLPSCLRCGWPEPED